MANARKSGALEPNQAVRWSHRRNHLRPPRLRPTTSLPQADSPTRQGPTMQTPRNVCPQDRGAVSASDLVERLARVDTTSLADAAAGSLRVLPAALRPI